MAKRRGQPAASAPGDLIAADRERALRLIPVSRETLTRLDRFVELLLRWQAATNLIAPSTVPQVWTRHVADSLQLLQLAPQARHWVDFGSGGGFPGLVIACALAEVPGASVELVESNQKKAAFLREAARAAGAPARVHAVRAEDFVRDFAGPVEIVTARALASLENLLEKAYPLLKRGAEGLFLKGQDVEAELTAASKCWTIDFKLLPSRTDPRGRLVLVGQAERRAKSL